VELEHLLAAPLRRGSLVTLLRPGLTFLNTGDRGFVRARGWLSHHAYWQESKLTGTDRGGTLEGDYKLSRRLSFFGSGSLARYQNQDQIRDEDTIFRDDAGEVEQVVPGEVVGGGVPDIDIRQGRAGARYELFPRTELSCLRGHLHRRLHAQIGASTSATATAGGRRHARTSSTCSTPSSCASTSAASTRTARSPRSTR
jgi:hypothetical protein